jgi:hypothetical protein
MNNLEPGEMKFFEKAHFYFNFSMLVLGLAIAAFIAGLCNCVKRLWSKL